MERNHFVDGLFTKTFQQPSSAEALLSYLQNNYPKGHYKACYEAGFCGFSVQRNLQTLGVECIVVNAGDVPETNKGILSKTDSSDSKRIAEAFAKGLLKPIYIPKADDEADRNLIRYRKRVQKDLKAKKQILKSTLNILGIKIPEEHDKPYWTNNFINWVQNIQTTSISTKQTLQLCIEDVRILRSRLLQTNKLIK